MALGSLYLLGAELLVVQLHRALVRYRRSGIGEHGNMNHIGTVLVALILAVSLIGPKPSAAEGALAIGTTGNVAEDGIAVGHAVNYLTREQAVASALFYCRGKNNHRIAPKAVPFCEIVGTFKRQCTASALDPANRTPGAGWATAATKEEAESQALANCQAVAGASRREFCKVTMSDCDTKDTGVWPPK
jgi:hypothetical protein